MTTKKVKIGEKLVGEGEPVFITAEIGINHNGDINNVKKLIDVAVTAGCDAVKFQKRTIEVVYTQEELARPRESVFGNTNGDLKRGLEFGEKEYGEIDRYCKEKGIIWFASPWDEQSADFLEKFNVPCYKIASASLTDDNLLLHVRAKGKPVILSTGMSTIEQIEHAVKVLGQDNLVLLHCTSTYPADDSELNLKVIPWLKETFSCPIGYSGHEVGVYSSLAAAAMGACLVERHITLDRAMWGSDQAASLEPQGLNRLVRDIRLFPVWLGDGKKKVFESEVPILQKLRRVNNPVNNPVNNHMKGIIQYHIDGHIDLTHKFKAETPDIESAAVLAVEALRNGNKILVAGNGGSVADAHHFAAELMGRFKKERRALPALALDTNPLAVTAISNDYSFSRVFARQIEAMARKGDVFFGISTSGNSENILEAAKAARNAGCKVIGLTGKTGGKLAELCDLVLNIHSEDTPRIQEMHTLVIHTLSDLIEDALFP